MAETKKKSIVNGFINVAQRLGGQIHLRSLRDAFASIMPFMILAGFVTLINYVILEPTGFMGKIVNPDTLKTWQEIGISIGNGTLSVITLLVTVAISYHLCLNRGYKNVIAPILVALSSFIVVTPIAMTFLPEGASKSIEVPNVIPVSYTGASGMFVGIIVGLIATDLFIKLSKNKRMQINLTGNIPPAVIKSFNVLIPIMITVIIFSVMSFAVNQIFNMDFNTLVTTIITKPLSYVTTSLPGFLLITSIANLFFGLGIHQAVISGPLLDPFLLQNMQENMVAYANHQEIPHIINMAFKDTFAVMGGSGNTIGLLIAIFIFGLPIVFNPLLIIPFVLAPIFSLTTAYYATAAGWINHVVVQTPWTTPPIISGFLATGGDWRASVLQVIIIVVTVFIYLPFLRMDEKVAFATAQKTEAK
ncbi:PTS sugar transporter subunit IIC [Listeria monocytogenes]